MSTATRCVAPFDVAKQLGRFQAWLAANADTTLTDEQARAVSSDLANGVTAEDLEAVWLEAAAEVRGGRRPQLATVRARAGARAAERRARQAQQLQTFEKSDLTEQETQAWALWTRVMLASGRRGGVRAFLDSVVADAVTAGLVEGDVAQRIADAALDLEARGAYREEWCRAQPWARAPAPERTEVETW